MKFTIRDLFLLTVIVALVLGWVLDHYRSARMAERARYSEQRSAVLERVLRENGWDVTDSNGYVHVTKVSYPSDPDPITTYALPISAPTLNPFKP